MRTSVWFLSRACHETMQSGLSVQCVAVAKGGQSEENEMGGQSRCSTVRGRIKRALCPIVCAVLCMGRATSSAGEAESQAKREWEKLDRFARRRWSALSQSAHAAVHAKRQKKRRRKVRVGQGGAAGWTAEPQSTRLAEPTNRQKRCTESQQPICGEIWKLDASRGRGGGKKRD